MTIDLHFELAPHEVQLLDSFVSREVIGVQCLGYSFQSAVPEAGVLCQAVVLRTRQNGLVIKPVCENLIDIEVFWMSVRTENDPEFVEAYSQLPQLELENVAPGKLIAWQLVSSETTYERKGREPTKAKVARGVLLQLELQKKLLITISGLPFFVHCFTDPHEIDAELAAMGVS